MLGSTQNPVLAIGAGVTMQSFLFGMGAVLCTCTLEPLPSRAQAPGCGFASFCGRIGALIRPMAATLVVSFGGVQARLLRLETLST